MPRVSKSSKHLAVQKAEVEATDLADENSTRRTTFHIPVKLDRRLGVAAASRDLTKSAIVRMALEAWLDESRIESTAFSGGR